MSFGAHDPDGDGPRIDSLVRISKAHKSIVKQRMAADRRWTAPAAEGERGALVCVPALA